ncbi:MAG: hypothetical protein N2450_05245 [bacterium]|nr:hypothetical protein [bacterium]
MRLTIVKEMVATLMVFAIIYFVPPYGFEAQKYGFSIVTALGVFGAGIVQVKILQKTPEKTLKAILIGITIRSIVVLCSIILVWKVASDKLFGITISIMLVYWVILLVELPWFKVVLNNQMKEKERESKTNG